MAGYGTAKMPTTDLNVGFPRAFSQAYARYGEAKEYYGGNKLPSMDFTEGDDFQAKWHEQKMRDANYYAMAKVKATHNHNARGFSSPHGYYKMPPPVLGQRKYANISSGAFNTHSTRDDQPTEGAPFITIPNGQAYTSKFRQNEGVSAVKLEGGVLRTSAGQRHGVATLNARIAQLNAINEAKMSWGSETLGSRNYTDFAGALPTFDDMLTGTAVVEVSNLLQNIKFTLIEMNESDQTQRDLFQDLSRVFPMIVKIAVNNPPQDIANILQFVEGTSAMDGISQLLKDRIDAYVEAGRELEEEADDASMVALVGRKRRYAERLTALLEWWNRLTDYLKEMIKIAEQPLKTRKNTSNALLKGLAFNKLKVEIEKVYLTNVVPEDLFIDKTGNIHNFQNAQRAVEFGSRSGSSGAMINPLTRAQNTYSASAPTREDSQQGTRLAYFDGRGLLEEANENQNEYAFGSGEFGNREGGEPRAFLGEEVGEEGTTAAPTIIDRDAERGTAEAAQDVALDRALAELQGRDVGDDPTGEKAAARDAEVEDVKKQLEKAGKKVSPTGVAKTYEYKLADIPSGEPIFAFVENLNKKHPEFKYAPRIDSEPTSVRSNTIIKLRKVGLMAP